MESFIEKEFPTSHILELCIDKNISVELMEFFKKKRAIELYNEYLNIKTKSQLNNFLRKIRSDE